MLACRPLSHLLIISTLTVIRAQDTPTPQWRPLYHFTPEKNWMNDPNGLIYVNGVYHLYYQYNPYGNEWNHISWGHATSEDLLHWRHLPVAMREKIDGNRTIWRFSGSAVWDHQNTSGFGTTADGPLVAIYTGAEMELNKQSQYVAYSNDGGMNYIDYEGNPVIDLERHDFRDPNVFWFENENRWIMSTVVAESHKVQFYESTDLKKWNLLSEFNDGDKRRVWECPSLTMHFVNGDPRNKKWLLMLSSANPEGLSGMQYFVGDFDGTTFTNDNSPESVLFVDYGKTFYAAVPYNNLPDNESMMIGWLNPSDTTSTWPWRGQMSIPRDIQLRSTLSGIRLYQKPAAVLTDTLKKLPNEKRFFKDNFTLENSEMPLPGFRDNSWWIDIEFLAGSADLFGLKICNDSIQIGYSAKEKQVLVGEEKMPVELVNGGLQLQVLLDKSSLEVFANNGEKVLTTLVYPKKEHGGITLFAAGGYVKVQTLRAWDLSEV